MCPQPRSLGFLILSVRAVARLSSHTSFHLFAPPNTGKCHFPPSCCSEMNWVTRSLRNNSFVQKCHGNQTRVLQHRGRSWQGKKNPRFSLSQLVPSVLFLFIQLHRPLTFSNIYSMRSGWGLRSSARELQGREIKIHTGGLIQQTLPCPRRLGSQIQPLFMGLGVRYFVSIVSFSRHKHC